jgi:hypothetical protein
VRPAVRVGLVAAGYLGAFLVAAAAVAIRAANTSGPAAQASSGMYAFGDAYLFVAVLGLLALVPTGAALYWLRPYRKFWAVLSAVAVGVALTGIAAATLFAVGRDAAATSALSTWANVSVLRILLAPILVATWLVVACIAPYRRPRLALAAATAGELAVVLFAVFAWIVPLYFPTS